MIEFRNVYAGYGGGDVLQGLDLKVEDGSITCIVGPNGAGKSTVLRVLSGLIHPRVGEVRLGGAAIHDKSPAAVLAAGIAQVPQHNALFGNLTVHDNMLLGGYILRRNRRAVRRRVDELAEIFPTVAERAHEKALNLSGGQRRIVEFARALMTGPSVLVLDEPTLGLDPKTCQAVFETTKKINSLGTTILMVEQNVRFGLKLASHGVVMERGRALLAEPADDLLRRPDMGAMFFGHGIEDPTAAPQIATASTDSSGA
ncbi:ABC transporter ATP-binding protein [Dactylosporangium sucinum]|uniref:ABC transporter ATP-binding protein n=1 Tax=Dactylosporangium sucinum TaxID=1424081 RepID=A0A917UEI2_9ACTN|nr:ABC transporter ATP-binding protein [Dactylosporangium sucinum]